MEPEKPLSLDSIDIGNEEEFDALIAQVLAEGDKIYAAQRAEAIRLGIIDEQGQPSEARAPRRHARGRRH